MRARADIGRRDGGDRNVEHRLPAFRNFDFERVALLDREVVREISRQNESTGWRNDRLLVRIDHPREACVELEACDSGALLEM